MKTMKKYLSALLLLILSMIITVISGMSGCGVNGGSNSGSGSSAAKGGIDLDLTMLSSTLAYGEAINIISNPKDYAGRTIKIRGPYYADYQQTGSATHYVIVSDETSCCRQGLRFIWDGMHKYPEDYPYENAQIELVGEYKTYEEYGRVYGYLFVGGISILD